METIRVDDRRGNLLEGEIVEHIKVGAADLLYIWLPDPGMRISMIVYPDNGAQWTPWDWMEGEIPADEIAEHRWLRQDGLPAIMFDGLPTALG